MCHRTAAFTVPPGVTLDGVEHGVAFMLGSYPVTVKRQPLHGSLFTSMSAEAEWPLASRPGGPAGAGLMSQGVGYRAQ